MASLDFRKPTIKLPQIYFNWLKIWHKLLSNWILSAKEHDLWTFEAKNVGDFAPALLVNEFHGSILHR